MNILFFIVFLLLLLLFWYLIWIFFLKEIPFLYDIIKDSDKENESILLKKWKHKCN